MVSSSVETNPNAVETTTDTTEHPPEDDDGGDGDNSPLTEQHHQNSALTPQGEPVVHPLYPPKRVFTKEQLEVLNLLVHPAWVFDIDNRCMRWANQAAVELWNATSLQEMLDRDFGDMSEATVTRLATYQSQFRQGQRIFDQWTFYPKGEPKTVHVVGSGVRLSVDEVNPSMFIEATPALEETLQPQTLRVVEMIRHLPLPVCQFDMSGKIMFQNPEATLPSAGKSRGGGGEDEDEGEVESTTSCADQEEEMEVSESKDSGTAAGSTFSIDSGDFLPRFVDQNVGREVLRKMQSETGDNDEALQTKSNGQLTIEVEAQVVTRSGPRWSAVRLRRTSDPVTGQAVILYSARDMTDALRAQKEREARIANSEFLAIMAHEIRTPLHQVTGFIDLLDHTELDAEQRSFVTLLKSSANGLMTVINDVLDLSKLEAKQMKLESISYEPRSVLEGSMEAVRSSCEEKNLYLEMDWNTNMPFKVMGDPNRLRQILLNLLSNAIKFTKKGGIKVHALPETSSENHPMIKFVVSDTGMGISEEHQELIFNKYQQANVSVARNFGGTGLGLSICKLLCQNMGGSIGFTSRLGQGSSFWFKLPAAVPNEEDLTSSRSLDVSFRRDGELHILVAEDNKVNQKLLASMLKRMGHTSEIACNGKVAIDMIERNHFDVILMDIQMPIMDGLEATRRIRSMGFTSLPILGLTASVARTDFTELGFTDWLPKPIPMRELKSKLYRIMSQQQDHDGAPLPRIREKKQ